MPRMYCFRAATPSASTVRSAAKKSPLTARIVFSRCAAAGTVSSVVGQGAVPGRAVPAGMQTMRTRGSVRSMRATTPRRGRAGRSMVSMVTGEGRVEGEVAGELGGAEAGEAAGTKNSSETIKTKA